MRRAANNQNTRGRVKGDRFHIAFDRQTGDDRPSPQIHMVQTLPHTKEPLTSLLIKANRSTGVDWSKRRGKFVIRPQRDLGHLPPTNDQFLLISLCKWDTKQPQTFETELSVQSAHSYLCRAPISPKPCPSYSLTHLCKSCVDWLVPNHLLTLAKA